MAVFHGKGAKFGLPKPVDACGQARCEYCGRYGALGSCLGCGAPNRPVNPFRSDCEYVEITVFGDARKRFLEIPPREPDIVRW